MISAIFICIMLRQEPASQPAPRPAGPAPSAAEAVEALRAGKHASAMEMLKRLEAAGGDEMPAELFWDQSLAALGAGDVNEAEAAAEKAAARGGERFERRRDFMRGNIAFRKAEAIEHEIDAAQTKGGAAPGEAPQLPDPSQYDAAIEQAQQARDAWMHAALGTESRAAATRNTERAIAKAEELKKKKEELEKKKKEQQKQQDDQKKDQKKDQKDDPPQSQPESKPSSRPQDSDQKPSSSPSDPKPDEKKDDPKDQQQQPKDDPNKKDDKQNAEQQAQEDPKGPPKELPAEKAQRLLDKLNDKEKERQQLMRAKARVVKVPKDW